MRGDGRTRLLHRRRPSRGSHPNGRLERVSSAAPVAQEQQLKITCRKSRSVALFAHHGPQATWPASGEDPGRCLLCRPSGCFSVALRSHNGRSCFQDPPLVSCSESSTLSMARWSFAFAFLPLAVATSATCFCRGCSVGWGFGAG